MLRKIILTLTALVVGGFLLIQLVPYGRNHTNPPVIQEPAWDSPQTQELFTRACADCHSNTTVWPWYSNVAPCLAVVQQRRPGLLAGLQRHHGGAAEVQCQRVESAAGGR